MTALSRPVNFMSIDVEDYFHVSAFEDISAPDTWGRRESRVARNTEKVLELLADAGVRGTFFTLGWVAEHHPGVVRAIAAQGHEVACHGYWHQRMDRVSREDFRQELLRCKGLLEDQSGQAILGFRAPSYSVSPATLWMFDELLAAGFRYDSSVFPIAHDFYGLSDWPDSPFWVQRQKDGCWAPGNPVSLGAPLAVSATEDRLLEVPIATLQLGGRRWPIAGGGYFRLYPYALTRWGLQQLNGAGTPFVFYLHPWEFDPEQPRMVGARLKSRFRHYLNLNRTAPRFRQLTRDFAFQPLAQAFAPGLAPACATPAEQGE